MHDHQYTNMGNSIQEILGKTWDEISKQVKESDTVTGDVAGTGGRSIITPNPKLDKFKKELDTDLNETYTSMSNSIESIVKEDGHTDVSSMKQKVSVGMKALQTLQQELGKIPDEGSLPTWWTNKVAIAVDKLDGMADYLDTKVESVKIEEQASMSSINDLVQGIREKKIVYADVTQKSRQGHKFYLKGKPEISQGDILIRMDGDKSQFIQIQIEQIKDIRTKGKAVSINLKK